MTKISQREARRLRKRVRELEDQRARERAAWGREYPGGKHIVNCFVADDSRAQGRLEAAVMFEKVLVAKLNGERIVIYAI